jgi:hypothetical protein
MDALTRAFKRGLSEAHVAYFKPGNHKLADAEHMGSQITFVEHLQFRPQRSTRMWLFELFSSLARCAVSLALGCRTMFEKQENWSRNLPPNKTEWWMYGLHFDTWKSENPAVPWPVHKVRL